MKYCVVMFAALLVGLTLTGDSRAAPQVDYQVVNRYPHDPEAFTQGLLFYQGKLYESTGRYGRSSIREVVLDTGEVTRNRSLTSQYFGEGLALVGDRLIQLTWRAGKGLVYRLENFQLLETFKYPSEGWGLTYDGEHLIKSNGSETLAFLDPNAYAVTREIKVLDGGRAVKLLNELEYIDGKIYANVWLTNLIAIIDPDSGAVENWLDLSDLRPDSGNVLNGIAFDATARRLFVTGKLWPWLYEIRLLPAAKP